MRATQTFTWLFFICLLESQEETPLEFTSRFHRKGDVVSNGTSLPFKVSYIHLLPSVNTVHQYFNDHVINVTHQINILYYVPGSSNDCCEHSGVASNFHFQRPIRWVLIRPANTGRWLDFKNVSNNWKSTHFCLAHNWSSHLHSKTSLPKHDFLLLVTPYSRYIMILQKWILVGQTEYGVNVFG